MIPLNTQYTALALMSDISVGVLLDAEGTEVTLLPLKPRPDELEVQRALEKWDSSGLRHVGVVGFYKGFTHSQLEPSLLDSTVLAIAEAFAVYINRLRRESNAGDEVAWLKALFALEDERPYPHSEA